MRFHFLRRIAFVVAFAAAISAEVKATDFTATSFDGATCSYGSPEGGWTEVDTYNGYPVYQSDDNTIYTMFRSAVSPYYWWVTDTTPSDSDNRVANGDEPYETTHWQSELPGASTPEGVFVESSISEDTGGTFYLGNMPLHYDADICSTTPTCSFGSPLGGWSAVGIYNHALFYQSDENSVLQLFHSTHLYNSAYAWWVSDTSPGDSDYRIAHGDEPYETTHWYSADSSIEGDFYPSPISADGSGSFMLTAD